MLGAIRYQANRVTLHTDASLMPRQPAGLGGLELPPPRVPDRVSTDLPPEPAPGLGCTTPVLVTLNRDEAIDPAPGPAPFDYAHPVLDAAAVAAQERHAEISGVDGISFCGAYWGSGFHEDGLQSALDRLPALGVGW